MNSVQKESLGFHAMILVFSCDLFSNHFDACVTASIGTTRFSVLPSDPLCVCSIIVTVTLALFTNYKGSFCCLTFLDVFHRCIYL